MTETYYVSGITKRISLDRKDAVMEDISNAAQLKLQVDGWIEWDERDETAQGLFFSEYAEYWQAARALTTLQVHPSVEVARLTPSPRRIPHLRTLHSTQE